MIEGLVAKHLAVEGHTEIIAARFLVEPGLASFTCEICGLSCSASNQMTFIDWDLNSFTVCPPCYDYEMYHKIQQRKQKPYFYLKKEIARKHGIPFP